jgi:hypothetical protein
MNSIVVDIDSIIQDADNARTHSKSQLQGIAASLKRFGQQKPLVVSKDNVIICGNGTHEAAKSIGWKQIAIVVSDLSVQEARAYGISDNRLSEQSEWNFDTLTKHIKTLSEWNPMQDWKAVGFDEDMVTAASEEKEENEGAAIIERFLEGKPPLDKPDTSVMGTPIKVTAEQRDIIVQGINIVKLKEEDYTMSEGRALELLVADWLCGERDAVLEEEK